MNVAQSVQPKLDTHPRAGQAGAVQSHDTETNVVKVKWDIDGEVTDEQAADLRVL